MLEYIQKLAVRLKIYKFFKYFEHTRIHGEPKTSNLLTLCSEVHANAQSVHTTLGEGQNGHLGLVCSAQVYALISGTAPYVRPANPGQLHIPQNATQYQIAQLRDEQEKATCLFNETLVVEKTIIQQKVASLDTKFLKAIQISIINKITRLISKSLNICSILMVMLPSLNFMSYLCQWKA